jgi:hypothetical protein
MKRVTPIAVAVVSAAACITLAIRAVIFWNFHRGFRFPSGIHSRLAFPDGKHRQYYPNGALRGEWTYKEDKLDGEGIELYENGMVKYKDLWAMGELAYREVFDTNGTLLETYGARVPGGTSSNTTGREP